MWREGLGTQSPRAAALCLGILRSCHKARKKRYRNDSRGSHSVTQGTITSTRNAQGSMGCPDKVCFSVFPAESYYFFFCQSKEKVSPSPQQREWPPLYAGKSPGCVRGKISKKRAARKVKMQAGLGWEVCGALIPLHRGTDFNKAGSLRGKAAVDSRVLPWQALLLCSLFRVFTFQAL